MLLITLMTEKEDIKHNINGDSSIELPTIKLPPAQRYETISIPLPTADVPSYVPLVVPPSDLREPEGTEPEATEEAPTGIRQIDIPFTDFKNAFTRKRNTYNGFYYSSRFCSCNPNCNSSF